MEDHPNTTCRSAQDSKASTPKPSCAPPGIHPPQIISTESLFAGSKLLVIEHAGEHYRLSITRNNKLILQK